MGDLIDSLSGQSVPILNRVIEQIWHVVGDKQGREWQEVEVEERVEPLKEDVDESGELVQRRSFPEVHIDVLRSILVQVYSLHNALSHLPVELHVDEISLRRCSLWLRPLQLVTFQLVEGSIGCRGLYAEDLVKLSLHSTRQFDDAVRDEPADWVTVHRLEEVVSKRKDDDQGQEVQNDVKDRILAEEHHQVDYFVEHDDAHLEKADHKGDKPIAELPVMVQRELHELVGCVQFVCHVDMQVSGAQKAAHYHTDAIRVGLNRIDHIA